MDLALFNKTTFIDFKVAVHRCSSSCFAEVFAREHGHHWTTIGVSGYGPWLISTSRSLIRCSRRGCRHRRTHFRTSRSLQTLHPSTPPALRSLRLQAIVMASRCQRTTPQPPPPSIQTPIALAVCKSRSLRFTGVITGAVQRLVRNLVAWRRSGHTGLVFNAQHRTPDVRAVKRLVPRLRGDARRPFRVTVFDRRQLADETIGVSLPYFPGRTRSALQSTE